MLPEVRGRIAILLDKKSWDSFKSTSKDIYKTSMTLDVLTARGSSFKVGNISDLKEISERFYGTAPCHLPISFVCQPQDEDLSYLQNATHIDLSNCLGITDGGLTYLRNAEYVNLVGCDKVTDVGLAYLKNATYVDLHRCDQITDAGLAHLINSEEVDGVPLGYGCGSFAFDKC